MWPYVFLGSEFLMIEAFEGVVTDAETERRRKFVKLPKAIKMDETIKKIKKKRAKREGWKYEQLFPEFCFISLNHFFFEKIGVRLFSPMIYFDINQVDGISWRQNRKY